MVVWEKMFETRNHDYSYCFNVLDFPEWHVYFSIATTIKTTLKFGSLEVYSACISLFKLDLGVWYETLGWQEWNGHFCRIATAHRRLSDQVCLAPAAVSRHEGCLTKLVSLSYVMF